MTYKIGRVYKIIHNQSDLVYIGSTFNTLRNRWQCHKDAFKKWLESKDGCISIYPYFEKYGIENFKIILVKEYKVVDRKQLLIWETMWMNKLRCVNKQQGIDLFCGRCCHDRKRGYCKECKGSQICEHDRRRSHCKECGGSQICEHDRERGYCKECGGSQICEHNRERSYCKECGGSQICEHDRRRSHCKECGGSQICEHGRQRSSCKDCKGSQICEHGRRRSHCKICFPVYCQPCQKLYSEGTYKRHCKTKKHLKQQV